MINVTDNAVRQLQTLLPAQDEQSRKGLRVHGLSEVFECVRLHYSELDDERVLERGRAYITRWIDAGWIRISDAPIYPSTITTLPDGLSFCSITARPLHATWRIRRRLIPQKKLYEFIRAKRSNQSVELTATRRALTFSND